MSSGDHSNDPPQDHNQAEPTNQSDKPEVSQEEWIKRKAAEIAEQRDRLGQDDGPSPSWGVKQTPEQEAEQHYHNQQRWEQEAASGKTSEEQIAEAKEDQSFAAEIDKFRDQEDQASLEAQTPEEQPKLSYDEIMQQAVEDVKHEAPEQAQTHDQDMDREQ